MGAVRKEFRNSLAFDRLTELVFGLFGYVALAGGIGVSSPQFRSVTLAAILLAVVLIARRVSGFPTIPNSLKKTFEFFGERPSWVGALIFLPLALSMILRPLWMQMMFEDAGAVNQSIFQFFGTPPLHCNGCFRESFLGDHQAYTLFFPWVWVQVFRTPYAIPYFAVACAVLTLGSIAWRFRRTLSAKTLTFFVIAIFAVRGFRAGYAFDFREDSLAAVFFALTLVLAHGRRWGFAAVSLFLAAISKETGAILAPMLLPWFFFELRDFPKAFRIRWLVVFTGTALLGAYLSLVLGTSAWTSSTGESGMLIGRLSYLGSTPIEIFTSFVTEPWKVFSPPGAGASNHARYLVHTVLPFLPFMVLAWNWAYFPGLVLAFGNLISLSTAQRSMGFHYDLLILPFFAFGLAASLASRKKIFTESALGFALLPFLILSGVWPIVSLIDLAPHSGERSERVFVRESAARIPASTPVLVDIWTYPHLVDHSELRLLPGGDRGRRPFTDAEFAIAESMIVDRTIESRQFFEKFERKGCSPSGRFCFWEKRK